MTLEYLLLTSVEVYLLTSWIYILFILGKEEKAESSVLFIFNLIVFVFAPITFPILAWIGYKYGEKPIE